jgi:hypothetical protein
VKILFSRHIIFSERSGSRTLKVLLSVGGWTYSQDGHFAFVTNPTLRATFIASAIQLIKDYGFDGMCVAPFLLSGLFRFDFAAPIVATSTLNTLVAPLKVAPSRIF